VLAVLGVLGGCSLILGGCSLRQASPPKQTFLLETKRARSTGPGQAIRPGAGSGQSVLRVRDLQVAAPFAGRGFVYRRGDWQYESDFYHELLVPPRAALTEQVRLWLRDSSLFDTVLESASKADAALSLEGTVDAFYGDFREQDRPRAVLDIHFVVSDEHSASSAILFQHSYRQAMPLQQHGPDALVAGWSKALEQILGELERDLSSRLDKKP
jgi:cholesterol transport system auxiliary component